MIKMMANPEPIDGLLVLTRILGRHNVLAEESVRERKLWKTNVEGHRPRLK